MDTERVDLHKIDIEAGKPWGQLVRDDELGNRHQAIRTKHRANHLAKVRELERATINVYSI
jgi:hypothetical protein